MAYQYNFFKGKNSQNEPWWGINKLGGGFGLAVLLDKKRFLTLSSLS